MESLNLFSLEFMERLRPVFRGGSLNLLTLLTHLNFLRSDLEIKKSASRELPWCSLLWRDLHCSSGLVIKPDHLWGTKSHLHVSNEFEKCHSQQARLALTPTAPPFGSGGLVEQDHSHSLHCATPCAQHLLHELGDSHHHSMLSFVSKEHNLLKNSPELTLCALPTHHKLNRNSQTD